MNELFCQSVECIFCFAVVSCQGINLASNYATVQSKWRHQMQIFMCLHLKKIWYFFIWNILVQCDITRPRWCHWKLSKIWNATYLFLAWSVADLWLKITSRATWWLVQSLKGIDNHSCITNGLQQTAALAWSFHLSVASLENKNLWTISSP